MPARSPELGTASRRFQTRDTVRAGEKVWIRPGSRALFTGDELTPGWREVALDGPNLIGDLVVCPPPGGGDVEHVRSSDCEIPLGEGS